MKYLNGLFSRLKFFGALWVVAIAPLAQSQPASAGPRQYRPGSVSRIEDLPASRLRSRLERLPAPARTRALSWLNNFHFTASDLNTLDVDPNGGVFYVDTFTIESTGQTTTNEPATAQATALVNPLPASLVLHSRPGAPNVLYLNFTGATISNTAWNTSISRSVIPAVAFSTDSDFTTFSDAEQTAIKRIWERVAEDYAPFNTDVTTEKPASFGTRTAMALITRSTDADGADNPSSTAGGIAYINVFANSSYANYRPAWIYYDNLSSTESFIAEAVSHELGHNLGLSHDGKTDGADYYGGHGSGDISWGPIMGTGYNRNVSQWSKGEYYLANNTQDDLAIISGKMPYLPDDHGNTAATATPLVVTGGTNIVSTTPETDPANANPANKGVLGQSTDVDVFSFSTGTGPINLTVKPWVNPAGTRGGNLDVSLELRDATGALLLTNNSPALTTAQIQTNLPQGTYFLFIKSTGVGNPLSATPSGYTAYASIGQYFISGYIAPSGASTTTFALTTSVNEPDWGSVTPASDTYAAGTSVQLLAIPAPYYQFSNWTNGASGTANPLVLNIASNQSVEAVFTESVTTNFPTPLWWLAAAGYTNDFESAVSAIGANGIPLWQSYVAGLNPNRATDQLRLSLSREPAGDVLKWNTATGRAYTVLLSTNLTQNFTPIPGASDLPASVQGFTNSASPTGARFYRIEVKKP